jgi:signal transduction histidine kinase/integral membrane sensor domain MASE1
MKTLLNRSHLIVLVLVAVAYCVAGKLGLSLAREHPSASVVWPPTGIAFAALLLFGWRTWPAVLIGAFFVNITTAGNAATSLGIAIGNTLEALVAVWLLNRFANGRHAFERVKDVFTFILLAAVASTTISPTIGLTSLALGGFAEWSEYGKIWTTWWLGDAVGATVVTPLLLAWSSSSPLRWNARRVVGAAMIFVALLVVSEAIFGGIFPQLNRSYSLPFLAIPILVWIGLRFGHREAATAMFLMSVIAVISVVRGAGPFVDGTPHQSLIALQAFIGVVSIISMVVSAEISERRSAEHRLDAQQATARILGEATSVNAAIPLVLATICEKLRWDIGAFWKLDSATGSTECADIWANPRIASIASDFIAVTQSSRFQRGVGLPGRAWQGGQIVWIDNVVVDPNFPRAQAAIRAGLCSAFGFPVIVRDRVLAVIEFFSREARRADDELLSMMEAMGSQIGLLIERTQSAAELENRKAEAEAANKAKDNFLAMLSHELRTPLTPIISAIDQLEATLPPGIDNRILAATIRRNVELEARLIDDLLDVTRLGQGKIELRKRPVDAHQSVRDAIALCRSAMGARDINLHTALDAANSWVNADATRIQQIVWNLLQNAVKFSPPGSTISVVSENVEDGKGLIIRVADCGAGIEVGFLDHVFEPFVQGEEAVLRRYGGLGLGLSISKALAEMHEGTLTARSGGRGQGAAFTLTLRTIEKPAEAQRVDVERRASKQSARTLRILLVDDHADTREGLERLLRRKGHQVQTAGDMHGALNLAASNEYDLLISDLGLPDGSGHELMNRLRERNSIKAIAISGFGMERDIEASKASGFSDHLVKPIEFARLEAAILELAGDR